MKSVRTAGLAARGVLALVLGSGIPAAAQSGRPWTLYESVQGSFDSAGQLLKFDSSLAYRLNDHFEIAGGLPVYLVRASGGIDTQGHDWNTGIGNAYVDFRLSAGGDTWAFSSSLRSAVPTGDRDRGFSTGRVTLDWSNSVAYYLPRLTAFGGAGVANTVSDTTFFVRPFTSNGVVGHFDGGVFLPFNPWLGLGVLGYAVEGGGEQRIISRLIREDRIADGDRRRQWETTVETLGEDLADDHGFSGWLDVYATPEVNVQVGYSRSVEYAYDTTFFSVGFDVLSFFGR